MFFLAGYSPETYLYSEQISISLGFITLASALAIIFSCRSTRSLLNQFHLNSITKNHIYQAFFKYHAYFWWIFWPIFVLHFIMGIMHIFMVPTIPDPDKYLHFYSLWSGLSGIILISGILFSCRILPGPLSIIFNNNPLNITAYKIFYKFHGYYWLVFLAIIASHYSFGFLHSGIWHSG